MFELCARHKQRKPSMRGCRNETGGTNEENDLPSVEVIPFKVRSFGKSNDVMQIQMRSLLHRVEKAFGRRKKSPQKKDQKEEEETSWRLHRRKEEKLFSANWTTCSGTTRRMDLRDSRAVWVVAVEDKWASKETTGVILRQTNWAAKGTTAVLEDLAVLWTTKAVVFGLWVARTPVAVRHRFLESFGSTAGPGTEKTCRMAFLER